MWVEERGSVARGPGQHSEKERILTASEANDPGGAGSIGGASPTVVSTTTPAAAASISSAAKKPIVLDAHEEGLRIALLQAQGPSK